jgi:hypothetical protein
MEQSNVEMGGCKISERLHRECIIAVHGGFGLQAAMAGH